MVGHAVSDSGKKQLVSKAKKANMKAAVDAYWAEQLLPEDKRRSLRKLAEEMGVNRNTLKKQTKGEQSISEFNAGKQKIRVAEESVLLDMIEEGADQGFPPTGKRIIEAAQAILQAREGPNEKLGEGWLDRFLNRHRDRIQGIWSRPLEMQRAAALNPAVVAHWFDLVKKEVIDLEVPPERIGAMDEVGVAESDTGKERVYGKRGTKTQHKIGGNSKKQNTVLVSILGDGRQPPKPIIIFPGKNFMAKWNTNNIVGAHLAMTNKGWTDRGVGINFLRLYDKETRGTAPNGELRVLYMDGHSSHYSYELLTYARRPDVNIKILGYPPHTTHALQGLDVACFARLKDIWKQELKVFEQLHGHGLKPENFVEIFGKAYRAAFTPELMQKAFEATGLIPFNPSVIKPAQMRPSETHSLRGSFPAVYSTPVRRVARVLREYKPSGDDVEMQSPSPGLVTPTESYDSNTTGVFTPYRRRERIEGIDPNEETPSKRARLLAGAVGSSQTTSFLVHSDPLSFAQRIAAPVFKRPREERQPDWSLARNAPPKLYSELLQSYKQMQHEMQLAQGHLGAVEHAIEHANAQLVVADLYGAKQRQALFAKDEKKRSKKGRERIRMYERGKGVVMTSDEIVAAMEKQREEDETEAKRKAQRSEAGKAKKASAMEFQAKWNALKAARQTEIEAWKRACEEMKSRGVRTKDLPQKPPAARKAELQEKDDQVLANQERVAHSPSSRAGRSRRIVDGNFNESDWSSDDDEFKSSSDETSSSESSGSEES